VDVAKDQCAADDSAHGPDTLGCTGHKLSGRRLREESFVQQGLEYSLTRGTIQVPQSTRLRCRENEPGHFAILPSDPTDQYILRLHTRLPLAYAKRSTSWKQVLRATGVPKLNDFRRSVRGSLFSIEHGCSTTGCGRMVRL
jgi:hypothetical protein